VPTKTVLKVGFLERHFERDHLAEKSNRTKMGQKIHCALGQYYHVYCTLQNNSKNNLRNILKMVSIMQIDRIA
jgi:hypothetical protein